MSPEGLKVSSVAEHTSSYLEQHPGATADEARRDWEIRLDQQANAAADIIGVSREEMHQMGSTAVQKALENAVSGTVT